MQCLVRFTTLGRERSGSCKPCPKGIAWDILTHPVVFVTEYNKINRAFYLIEFCRLGRISRLIRNICQISTDFCLIKYGRNLLSVHIWIGGLHGFKARQKDWLSLFILKVD
jgi:hypothetical protein